VAIASLLPQINHCSNQKVTVVPIHNSEWLSKFLREKPTSTPMWSSGRLIPFLFSLLWTFSFD